MLRHLPTALLILSLSAPVLAQSGGARGAQRSARACSLDAMPEAQKRRMMQGYLQRLRTSGKASADAWADAQGNLFRKQLVAEGVCPPLRGDSRRTARVPRGTGKRPLLNKQGKPCKRMTVENQVFPGFGGEPMTMGLVPVCQD